MLSLSFGIRLQFESLLLDVRRLRTVWSLSHFHLIKFIIYLQPKIVLLAKPLLNDALPSGSAAT
jgi:hypothetical protein